MPTYGLGATAQNLLNQPYGGISPFAPAGMTDAQRQGQLTTLQGMGSQYAPSQQYAQQMQGLLGQTANSFNQGMNSGQFGWNPQMQQSANLAQQAASGNPYMNVAAGANMRGMGQPGFGQSNNMYERSTQQPGFGASNQLYGQSTQQPIIDAAAGLAGSTMGQYGGGYSTGMADTINSTGASFDPLTNPAIGRAISSANSQLGQEFRHNTMPAMNRAAAGSGSGGYGGSRAGVAQGIREAGLATAMSNMTGQITSDAYESGLNRYVQDRGQTVNATLEALKSGGYLGMQGAQTLGNLGQMQGSLQQGAASGLANNAANQGQLMQGAASGIGNNTQNQAGNYLQGGQNMGNLSQQQRNAQLGAAGQIGGLGQNSLGQNNSMYQFGYGQMLPGAVNSAYQAGMAPGNVMQGIGNQLSGYGGMQQANNQAMVDWQNQAFNHAQQYPQSQFANYAANISPLTAQAGQQPVGPQQTSPLTGLVGGASAGYGAYNAWNQSQNPASSPSYYGQPGYSPSLPGTYGPQTAPAGYGVSGSMPSAPAVGGWGNTSYGQFMG